MKFSEWLRTHPHHSPITNDVAHKWNLLSGPERKGRINAARLVRVLGIPQDKADLVMAAFEQYRGTLPTVVPVARLVRVMDIPQDTLPTVVPASTLSTEVEQSGAV